MEIFYMHLNNFIILFFINLYHNQLFNMFIYESLNILLLLYEIIKYSNYVILINDVIIT